MKKFMKKPRNETKSLYWNRAREYNALGFLYKTKI